MTEKQFDLNKAKTAGSPALNEEGQKAASLGVLAAVGSYLIWAASAIYYKFLAHVPAEEVIAHRVVWSVVITGVYLLWRGRLGEISAALKNRNTVLTLALTSILISLNWGIYVWAVAQARIVEVALGYFMLPLVSVALGYVILGERLNGSQILAVTLALIAVTAQTIAIGFLPWVAVSLALLFALYGFMRKRITIGSSPGLLVEVLILAGPALGYLYLLDRSGTGHFGHANLSTDLLLMLSGPLTAIPLILFAEAVRRLRLVTVGLIFYLTPSLQFLIGVVLYGERVSTFKLATFGLIWIALVIFVVDALMRERRFAKS